MTFRVGQKVVCIKQGKWITIDGEISDVPGPECGKIYTIDAIGNNGYLYVTGDTGMIGLFRSPDGKIKRKKYAPIRFRPLVDEPKGMKVLRSILNNPKQTIQSDLEDLKEKV